MPLSSPSPPRPRWFSRRAVGLHVVVVLVVPFCLIAGWWQLQRALGGNTLSFVYVLEWPAFAVIAVWAWWVLVTGPSRPPAEAPAKPAARSRSSRREELLAQRRAPLIWTPDDEDHRLRAYNSRLAALAVPARVAEGSRRPR